MEDYIMTRNLTLLSITALTYLICSNMPIFASRPSQAEIIAMKASRIEAMRAARINEATASAEEKQMAEAIQRSLLTVGRDAEAEALSQAIEISRACAASAATEQSLTPAERDAIEIHQACIAIEEQRFMEAMQESLIESLPQEAQAAAAATPAVAPANNPRINRRQERLAAIEAQRAAIAAAASAKPAKPAEPAEGKVNRRRQAQQARRQAELEAIQKEKDLKAVAEFERKKTAQAAAAPSIYGDTILVPADLKHVVHLKVTQQNGAACGWHSLFNTWAIQQLIREGKPITSQAVTEKATQKAQFIRRVPEDNKVGSTRLSLELEIGDIIHHNTALDLNLENTFFMQYSIANKEINDTITSISLLPSGEHNTKLTTIMGLMRDHAINHISFICNTGSHWVIAVYSNRTLFYADSTNNNLVSGSRAYNVVKELSTKLGLN